MPSRQQLVERARRIQALAERPGTPQEGVTAAKMLADLLLKHNITAAELREPVTAEFTGKGVYTNTTTANQGFDQAARDFEPAWAQQHGRTDTDPQVVNVSGMPGVWAYVPKTSLRSSTSTIFVKMGGPAWNRNDSGFDEDELRSMDDFQFQALRKNLGLHSILISFKYGAAIARAPDENEAAFLKPRWFKVEPLDLRSLVGRTAQQQVRITSALLRAAQLHALNYG